MSVYWPFSNFCGAIEARILFDMVTVIQKIEKRSQLTTEKGKVESSEPGDFY